MTTVNVCCAIRQGSSYVRAFLNQVESLFQSTYELGAVVVVVDGDAVTDPVLLETRRNLRLEIVPEGPPSPPPFDMEERSIAWARVGNLAFERSLETPSDYTLWIESDLCFPCDLVELLKESEQDIVAPLIMRGDTFYDSWGFRDVNGDRLWNIAAFEKLARSPDALIELSSVGSCLLIRSNILADGVRMPSGYERGLLVGLCLEARRRGRRVFCRPDVVVVHPTSLWAQQVSRVVSCRFGDADSWTEVRPGWDVTIAGPYHQFVRPDVVAILHHAGCVVPERISVSFASNPRREVTLLVGAGVTLPPAPAGYGPAAPPRGMDVTVVGRIRCVASRVVRKVRRVCGRSR